jgi:hypothetical protein
MWLIDMKTVARYCALAMMLFIAGCRLFPDEAVMQGQSPLRPISPSPDSVALEIIWARFPLNDSQLNGSAWSEIDETQIAPAVYRELARNGFRAGVISGTPPDAIARALQLEGDHSETTSADEDPMLQTVDLTTEASVQRRLLQLRRGRRAEIQASEMLESVPLLISRNRELGGRTYRDVQAIYGLAIDPQPNQTVAVELTPELHFGQPRIRWTGGQEGILRQMPLREREVFEAMRMNVRLAPGEMLVLMGLPESASRLGQCFHTVETASGQQQKLVLIRLAQVPASNTFASITEN